MIKEDLDPRRIPVVVLTTSAVETELSSPKTCTQIVLLPSQLTWISLLKLNKVTKIFWMTIVKLPPKDLFMKILLNHQIKMIGWC